MLAADSEDDSDKDLAGLYETKLKKKNSVIKITVTVLYLLMTNYLHRR